MGGDIEVFSQGGVKFWEEKFRVQSPESRVQSPESRVQSPGSSPAFRICAYLAHTLIDFQKHSENVSKPIKKNYANKKSPLPKKRSGSEMSQIL